MEKFETENLNIAQGDHAKVIVITDLVSKGTYELGKTMTVPEARLFAAEAGRCGYDQEDFCFVSIAPPVPIDLQGSDAKVQGFLNEHREEFEDVLAELIEELEPEMVMTLGKWGLRGLYGKAMNIKTNRGTIADQNLCGVDLPVLPMLSPKEVLRFPERRDTFNTDFQQLTALAEVDYDVDQFRAVASGINYEWCLDLSEYVKDPPKIVSMDCETVGADRYADTFRLLSVSLTFKTGEALVVPLDRSWWNDEALFSHASANAPRLTEKLRIKLIKQLKKILENPNVHTIGHNLKFDIHALFTTVGIEVANWFSDTMQLAFVVDENQMSFALDDCVRRYLPQYAGYADCVTPDTKVLMADMSKKDASDLVVGDELCAFDESSTGEKGGRRRLRVGVVQGVQDVVKDTFRITTESGRSVKVSGGHLMLSKSNSQDKGGGWRWRRADQLTPEHILNPFPFEDKLEGFDAGYVAGILDGEGWCCQGSLRVGYSQRIGSVLNNTRRIIEANGIQYGHSTDKRKKVPVVNDTFNGHEYFRVLQKFAPLRLIQERKWVGCGLPTNGLVYDQIATIEHIGEQKLVGLKTSTQTLITNGLLSHNSFNSSVDKSRMDLVPHEPFLMYAGGDTDVVAQLHKVLKVLAQSDSRQWSVYQSVQMPTLRSFIVMERQGVRIDTTELANLEVKLGEDERELKAEIMREVPRAVLQEFEGNWNITPNFIRACLFGPNGIKVNANGDIDEMYGQPLEPIVFTKTTKEASTSAKDHLPFFDHVPFVRKIIQYGKLTKMRGTYVGKDEHQIVKPITRLKNGDLPKWVRDTLATIDLVVPKSTAIRQRRAIDVLEDAIKEGDAPEENPHTMLVAAPNGKKSVQFDDRGNFSQVQNEQASGFWQYLKNRDIEPRIHASFFLHRTTTGRTASANPNAQNFPKRGPLAKAYRKIFIPSDGYTFIESDLSQAELRIAAWMANETEMIRIYAEGGDIHASTAAATMGITDAKFSLGMEMDQVPLIEVKADWPGGEDYLRTYARDQRASVTVKSFCKAKRQQAKAVNFGFIYGMGWRKFKVYARTDYNIIYTDEEAERTRELFFQKYPRLQVWHRQMRNFAGDNGYVRALHGALRRLPNVESIDEAIQGASSRQAINSPVQRLASDLGIMALCRFVRDVDLEEARPVLFIHDANVVEARLDVAEEIGSALKFYMETPPLENWFGINAPLPIAADVAVGPNLCEMDEDVWSDLPAVAPSWYQRGEIAPDGMEEVFDLLKQRNIILVD